MTKKPFLNVLALTNMGVSSYCALRVSKLGWKRGLLWRLGFMGGVPEWLKGTGCKPVSIAYVGSNPTPTTIFIVAVRQ